MFTLACMQLPKSIRFNRCKFNGLSRGITGFAASLKSMETSIYDLVIDFGVAPALDSSLMGNRQASF